MPKRKFQKAFVDPISLIGIAFLIITLSVGVSVTNNPVKKFLIDSFAGGRVKNCADYGSAAKRNACEENKDAQDPTTQTYANQQAYRNAHPNQYPVTDSRGNHLSNEQQIEILTRFASTANPDPTSTNDIKAMCPTCNNTNLRNYATSSLNNFYYDKTKINQIEAQYQKEVQAKAAAEAAQATQIAQQKEQARLADEQRNKSVCLQDGGAWSGGGCSYQQQREAIAKTQELIRLNAEKIAQEKALAEEQRLAKLEQEQDIERIRLERAEADRIVKETEAQKLEEQKAGLQALEDARLEANKIAQENNPIVPPTTTEPENTNILNRIADKFNNAVTSTNLTGLGTTGLGGGNATILPPPVEVLDTVKNPGGIYKYALANVTSFGAGLATATVVTPGAPQAIMETILSNPLTQKALPYLLWADLADSATAGVQCASSGDASSPACSAAVASILAPPGAGLADDFADAMNTLRPRGPLSLNPLSGLSGDFSFPTSVADFDMTPSVGTQIDNVIAGVFDNIKQPLRGGIFSGQAPVINPTLTEDLTQDINPSEMLFAPREQSFITQVLSVDSPGFHPNTVDNIPRWDQSTAVINEVDLPDEMMRAISPNSTIDNVTRAIALPNDFQAGPRVYDTSVDGVPPSTDLTPVADQITNWVNTARNNITEVWDRNVVNGPIGDTIFGKPVLENLDVPNLEKIEITPKVDVKTASSLTASQIEDEIRSRITIASDYTELGPGGDGNIYEDLLTIVKRKIKNGDDPVTAVTRTIYEYHPRNKTPVSIDELAYKLDDPTALASRLTCGDKLNCLELPILEKQLFSDLGIESEVVISTGGTKGLPEFAYRHGALQVGDQVIGYYAPYPLEPNKFQQVAEKMKWGEFELNPDLPKVADTPVSPSQTSPLSNAINWVTGPNASLKTGAGFNTPTMIIGGIVAGYALEKTNIDEFIANLFASGSETNTPLFKLGKDVGERVKSLVKVVATPPSTENSEVAPIEDNENMPIIFGDEFKPIDATNKLDMQVIPTEIIIHWDGQPGMPSEWNTNLTFNGLSEGYYDEYTGLWHSADSHFGVDKNGVVQYLNMQGNTVQFSYGAKGYPNAINIEMAGNQFQVYTDGTTNVPQREIDNTVRLIIKLMEQYNISIDKVFGHSERDITKDIKYILDSNRQPIDIIVTESTNPTDRSKADPGINFMDFIKKQVTEQFQSNSQSNEKEEKSDVLDDNLYHQTDSNLKNIIIDGGAGKPFKNIGCGQTSVANILCKYSSTCLSPLEIAKMIPLEEYGTTGLTSTQSNIKILQNYGFTTDPYIKSLQYHLTEYMEPTDVLWISGKVGNIDHHTYLDGYTVDSTGTPVFNLNDSYFGDGYKCKTSGDSTFNCFNAEGNHIGIGAENANLYIIDTNQ